MRIGGQISNGARYAGGVTRKVRGRKREREILEATLHSRRAELLAIYGRRRIGKTFLIRHFLAPRAGTYVEVTGTKGGAAALQRRHFREALEKLLGIQLPDFSSWADAFQTLCETVVERSQEKPGEPIVLFFDELPWLATPRAGLLEALDYAWNAHLSEVPEVKLVLCGSAASWMLRRIVHAKGGLHNRITRRIRLDPLTLRDTQEYLSARRVRLEPRELIELYMALGGVPYYLDLVERGQSVAETVGALCFGSSAPLRSEFDHVFASLFGDADGHVQLLRTLAERKSGLSRNEIIAALGQSSGGGLNRRLQELEEAGFIGRVEPYGAKVKNTLFRLIDEYSLFYLKWIAPSPSGLLARGAAAHWRSRSRTPGYLAWAGYSFEGVCLKHALELQRALNIVDEVDTLGSWRWLPSAGNATSHGAQIDLLFDRRDGVINLCEMKFSTQPFVVTKSYARELKHKLDVFEARTRTTKRIILTLVAPLGLKPNTWSEDLVDQVLSADALFQRV